MSNRCKAGISFQYTPLSDAQVVKWLLQNRATVTSSLEYGMLDEQIILTYIDLDRLLEHVKLSVNERDTVDLVMHGYAVTDIAGIRGGQRQAYTVFYKRAVNKICQTCIDMWEQFYGDRPAKGFCY